jgi:hypothetical protein
MDKYKYFIKKSQVSGPCPEIPETYQFYGKSHRDYRLEGTLLDISEKSVLVQRFCGGEDYSRMTYVGITRVYLDVSGLAPWSENCKWYSSLPLNAVVSLFCESV